VLKKESFWYPVDLDPQERNTEDQGVERSNIPRPHGTGLAFYFSLFG
jgi:hypothetical protein